MTDETNDNSDLSARELKANWERLANSEYRDFYVASHPGWRDAEHWSAQAHNDTVAMLYGIEPASLADRDVLEIGCGVGRLVPFLSPTVRTYTGLDISSGMVAEAAARCASFRNARFLETDGLSIPQLACDRSYHLIISLAVLIHCPKDVIRSLFQSAYAQLAPGGQIRFQVRANKSDETGIQSPPVFEGQAAMPPLQQDEVVTEEQMQPIRDNYYMGHAFTYDEANSFLSGLTDGALTLLRFDPEHIYGWIEKKA